ncbi:sigma factor, partial [Pseudomonas syringae group genomosp. 7]|uniref:sigma factor n=1 Tax=Pseudomonas syringae group genomosp. 7 TaxID=251699 RepID=UPI00376F8A7E
MLTEVEDQLLVEGVERGVTWAFDLLVLKYQHKFLGLIVRFVHDTHEAKDVAQEAFIKAYRARGNLRGDSAFYTW